MRIGVFGGTFNPIHRGHIAIAEEVRLAMPLDEILFIPAGSPPHKKDEDVIPARHRLEMVRIAVEEHPHLSVSDAEIHRRGTSYTVDTVEELRKNAARTTKWHLIMGLDAFAKFASWRDPKRLSTLCHFIVVSRPGTRYRDLETHPFARGADPKELVRLDEGLSQRYELSLSGSTRLILLRVTPWEVSATEIRNQPLATRSKRNLLPPHVESYIMKHGLYLDPRSMS
jgi:nicotinate-nucleotide adenylyltransferase